MKLEGGGRDGWGDESPLCCCRKCDSGWLANDLLPRWQHTGFLVAICSKALYNTTTGPFSEFPHWCWQVRCADCLSDALVWVRSHLEYWHSWMGPEQSLSEQETYTSWSYKNNPWAILCGVNAGKNPLWFSLFRLFLYLYLTWGGVVGEGRKLLQCCNNIYTLILGNNYVTDPESHYHRKVKRKKKAILIYLVEEL